jgi:predicted amidophosphoribosyltransferase
MKISLILDHINGIHNDNRIENLRIVCPNCNAGLDTFAGKNVNKRNYYCKCGAEILKHSSMCITCFGKKKKSRKTTFR